MKLVQIISWKDPTKDHIPTPGYDLLVFGPIEADSPIPTFGQLQLFQIFSEHPEYKGVVKENMVVEVSSGHTTMVITFLEKRHDIQIAESIDTTAHHKKQIKKTVSKKKKVRASS